MYQMEQDTQAHTCCTSRSYHIKLLQYIELHKLYLGTPKAAVLIVESHLIQ